MISSEDIGELANIGEYSEAYRTPHFLPCLSSKATDGLCEETSNELIFVLNAEKHRMS
jgi:hypothetical protein